jgi:carboxyl-terminal processing protease
MRTIQIIIIIIATIILITALVSGVLIKNAKGKGSYPYFAILSEVLHLIDKNYVEEVNFSKIEDSIYIGLVKALGGESSFLNRDDIDYYYNPNIRGQADVGIIIGLQEGYFKIINIKKNSPADKAGVKVGNYIYSINDEPFYRISIFRAKSLLRGEPGTTVNIKVIEQRGRKPISYDLKRELITDSNIESKLINQDIKYLHLYNIDKINYNQLMEEVVNKEMNGIEDLIIDLRGCYSEDYEAVRKAASIFLQDGAFVYGIKKKNEKITKYKAEDDGIEFKGNVYLIIDSTTAKGCEVFASALKDNHKAYLMGTGTYGNASIQDLIFIDKDHAILLDTGLIINNANNAIQPDGINPDREYELSAVDKIRGVIESEDVIDWAVDIIKSRRLKKAA